MCRATHACLGLNSREDADHSRGWSLKQVISTYLVLRRQLAGHCKQARSNYIGVGYRVFCLHSVRCNRQICLSRSHTTHARCTRIAEYNLLIFQLVARCSELKNGGHYHFTQHVVSWPTWRGLGSLTSRQGFVYGYAAGGWGLLSIERILALNFFSLNIFGGKQ